MFPYRIVAQGFLEMPDTSEVPDLERETKLLDLDIPSVRDRDPDPESGPRLNITEFRLQGIVEYPELGITRQSIVEKIEAIRFELMGEGDRTESGFTLKELSELSNLVIDIEKQTQAEHVGPLEVQKFVFLIREQLRRRGVTVGMIETVADTITQIYRERGFILAKAYIPKQKVRDGIVSLTLLLGELGDIVVEDSRRTPAGLVTRSFQRNIGKPVTNERIDEALYLVNDIPGVRAQGFFSPGKQVGDTLMTVKVLEERWVNANVRLDNHGSERTSKNRAYADIYVHNPLGIGDEFYLGVLNSYDRDNNVFGSIRNDTMLYTPRLRSSIGYSTNDFVVPNISDNETSNGSGNENSGRSNDFTAGESKVSNASIVYHLKRSRVKNFSIELAYTHIDTDLGVGISNTAENARRNTLAFYFDVLNEKNRQLYLGTFALHRANTIQVGGLGEDFIGTDKYATFDASMLSFFRIPFTKKETRFLVKGSAQYAGKSLSNLHQLTLTGPARSRGFAVNGFQSDDGVYIGVDWIFSSLPFIEKKLFGRQAGHVIQPYLFVDGAYGVIHPLEPKDKNIRATFANMGVGLRLNYKKFSASISLADVLTDDEGRLQKETPRSNLYFDMQYSF